MAYPPAITLRPCTLGGSTALESGTQLTLTARITASRGLKWGATGWQFPSMVREVVGTEGAELSFSLPVTDLAGWRLNDDSGSIIDVSAPGSYTHTYTIKLTTLSGGRQISERTIGPFILPTGDGSPIDLDLMLPAPTIAGGVVLSAPGSATRGLIITDANVATIPPGTVTDNLAAYYNSGASAITVAGVELAAGSHAVWAWVSAAWVLLSSGTTTPPVDPSDTTAPVWSATLTTGTPTDTAVVIAASALATDDVAVTGYRWRLTGEGLEVARTITPSGSNFTLDGLTASTAYAAPVFWAVDAGGNKSAELTAQGFTTATPAPVWTTLAYDTFTDADDVLVTAHTPDTGTWSLVDAGASDELVIRSNTLSLRPVARDWPSNGLKKAITTGGWEARVTLDYNFASVGANKGLSCMFSCGLNFSVRIANRAITFASSHTTATETTGNTALAPDTGTIVVELTGTNQTDGVLTCTINGTLYRRWDNIVWNGQGAWNIGAMLTEVSFSFGGDIYVGGGGYSAVTVSSARIEQR